MCDTPLQSLLFFQLERRYIINTATEGGHYAINYDGYVFQTSTFVGFFLTRLHGQQNTFSRPTDQYTMDGLFECK